MASSAAATVEPSYRPFRPRPDQGDAAHASRYERALGSGASIISFDQNAARHYAALRVDRTIRPMPFSSPARPKPKFGKDCTRLYE